MKTLFYFIGIALVAVGIALGLWVTFWVMIVGGVVQIVDAIKMTPTDAVNIAVGLLRIMFSTLTGYLTFVVVTFIGGVFIGAGSSRRSSGKRF